MLKNKTTNCLLLLGYEILEGVISESQEDEQTEFLAANTTTSKVSSEVSVLDIFQFVKVTFHNDTVAIFRSINGVCDCHESLTRKEFYEKTPLKKPGEKGNDLRLAVQQNQIENAKCLIDILDVDEVSTKGRDGMTALHHAVEAGNTELIPLLAAKMTNKNPQDDSGNTPLINAVRLSLIHI